MMDRSDSSAITKERQFRELEARIASLEANSLALITDNERLKCELTRLIGQNEILRAPMTSVPKPLKKPPPQNPPPQKPL